MSGRLVGAALALLASGCGSSESRDLLVRAHDGGRDAGEDAAPPLQIDGGREDPTLGGPCIDDAQCDDAVPCTFDRCDLTIGRCRSVPDDTRCDDGAFCNGRERCIKARGCTPGPVEACDDGNTCTIDRCEEGTRSCLHAPRDSDRDGDVDWHCPGGSDCNEADPGVSGKHAEVCGNGTDDDCDDRTDEAECLTAAHDTCASPLPITAPGTYAVSTLAARRDHAASCGEGGVDVVATVTVPPGSNQDIDLWAMAESPVSLAVQRTCGAPASDVACGSGTGSARLRARNLPPGTYPVLISTARETVVELAVDLHAPVPRATNEACASPAPLAVGTPLTVELIDARRDLATICDESGGELTYALDLEAAADVRVYASTLRGNGAPTLSLRKATCSAASDELSCRASNGQPLFVRGLPPGRYIVTVGSATPLDVSLHVDAAPPTPAPADQTCEAPPPVVENGTRAFDLANHTDAIRDGCYPGGPNAAYALTLAVPSDVMAVGRFSQSQLGAVSLNGPACAVATRLACTAGFTPQRVSRRGLPAGDYRVVVADDNGLAGSLSVFTRPTVPPTIVDAPGDCASAVRIPPEGGFFTGSTKGKTAHLGASCDYTPSLAAPDQLLKLALTERRRVVFNMDGSDYATLLNVRQGEICPGEEVPGLCYVGANGARSFLERTLDAGTYWVQVDGYNGATGAWNLDVRVVEPAR